MRNHLLIAALYAQAAPHLAKQAAATAKDKVVENKREIAFLGVTAASVGLAARVAGFQAGYAFAQSNNS